jgi:hypothetical protein
VLADPATCKASKILAGCAIAAKNAKADEEIAGSKNKSS